MGTTRQKSPPGDLADESGGGDTIAAPGPSKFGKLPGLTHFAADPKCYKLYAEASAKSAGWLMPVVLSVVLVSYLDRTALSYTGALLIEDLGISEAYFGLAAGVFYIPYVLLGFPNLWLSKQLSVRFYLSFLMVWWGMSTLMTALVTTGTQLLIMRLSLGAAEAGTFPIIYYYLDLFMTPQDLVKQWGMGVLVTQQVSSVLSGPLTALVMWALAGALGLEGWQWVFLVNGSLAVMCGVGVYVFLLRPPSETKILTAEEREAVLTMKSEAAGVHEIEKETDFLQAFKSWKGVYIGVVGTLQNGPSIMLQIFTPLIVYDILGNAGYTSSQTAVLAPLLTAIPYLLVAGALTGTTLYIKDAPRHLRLWLGTVSLGVSLLLFLSFPLSYDSPYSTVAFLHLCILYAVYVAVQVPMESLPAWYMQYKGAASAFFAIYNSMKNISSIFTPVIMGYLSELYGDGTAAQLIGLMFILPTMALYVGFFYLVGEPFTCKPHEESEEDAEITDGSL